ncbi:MAG: aminotransferase, partial [Clostridiales Family XIII bacterium]|nr:aminotransferase [Clostridiales Family XIII bacterium]
MPIWSELTKGAQQELLAENRSRYEELKSLGLSLDLSRGKPGPDALELSNGMLGALEDFTAEDGTDARNYGTLAGLPELKRLFADLLDIPTEGMIVGGNSSLTHMYNTFVMLYLFGAPDATGAMDCKPWNRGDAAKVLCPVPGYDRHFNLSADFGAKLVNVSMLDDGPDMDEVEKLAATDPS